MHVIPARNAQEMLPALVDNLLTLGERRESRNGPVLKMPLPTTLVYDKPEERVIFWPQRDANPFFHFFESLWMMAGRNDLAYVTKYVASMANYSDDGKTLHGAYGYRWRRQFEFDQLEMIVNLLRANPDDRRCVLGMWDPKIDLGRVGKDFPCNTQAMFAVNNGRLDMTVVNRSNDAVMGAVGANVVHFSFLQEYMAAAIGVPIGSYWQVSNNMHLYLNTLGKVSELADIRFGTISGDNPYISGEVAPFPIVNGDAGQWMQDLNIFLEEGPIVGLRDRFFRRVATPMFHAHAAFKKTADPDRFVKAQEIIDQCQATDWKLACKEWLQRREVLAQARVKKETLNEGE